MTEPRQTVKSQALPSGVDAAGLGALALVGGLLVLVLLRSITGT